MITRDGKYRKHWYSGIVESLAMFIPGSKPYNTIQARRARTGYLFMLPFIIGFIAFLAKPLIQSFWMSFCEVTLIPGVGYNQRFIGMVNIDYMFNVDSSFKNFLLVSIKQILTNTLSVTVFAFVLAVILNNEFKGRLWVRAILFLPVILSSGVLPGMENPESTFHVAKGMAAEMQKVGGVRISEGLRELLAVSGMGSTVFTFLFELIDSIYDIVMASGIQIIVFLSGLQNISPSMYEAAAIEGCSAWESFWKITFPMVCPLLLVNCVYTTVDCFMKKGDNVMYWVDFVMYRQGKFGTASGMAWVYFGFAAAFLGVCALIINKGVKAIND